MRFSCRWRRCFAAAATGRFLWKAGAGRSNKVTPGHINTQTAKVWHAVSEGGRVVVYPGDNIDSGVLIRDRAAATR